MLPQEQDSPFKDILHSIHQLPRLAPQERRVIIRELIACCDEGDLQVLHRLLGQTNQSGYDLVSALPVEVSHHLFLYLDGMELVRCQAVCRSWRGIIQGNGGLWKAKVRDWDPAECTLLKDVMDYQIKPTRSTPHHQSQQTPPMMHDSHDKYPPAAEIDSLLDWIESRPGFIGWKEAVVRELVLKQNWKWGRCAHQLTLSLTMDIKPMLLAWPLLILVDNWPRIHKISLDGFRGVQYREFPQGNGRHYQMMEVPRGHGSVSCVAWDTTGSATTQAPKPTETGDVEEGQSLPLALGGFLRTVRMCDPETETSTTLPNVLHGFALHLCYLRDKIISVTLDGHVIFFPKLPPFVPVRSSSVNTKVLQVMAVDFGSRTFERGQGNLLQSWQAVVCLAHEDGVIIKDEHSQTLCQVQLELGAKLIHIQAIADNTWPYRNELLILYEEPNTRQRLVLCVQMEPGYREESSRRLLTPSFSLGRGGDARDSIAMYRDRIGIMSHRNCSSDLGHYCVLRLMDLKQDVAVSTEYARSESVDEEEAVADGADIDDGSHGNNEDEVEDGGEGGGLNTSRVHMRGKAIRLDHSTVNKAAYRILALDHARIVLGVGPRTVKILYLV
ncbi:hypothetical protein EC957_009099 [Mortierella hygrophila]|uniref:F-box domain-containing protein n=1 Tax=Mortierella hygrophila TaxID=979708 RepID=A0A9P6FC81_9FUNG|nr:hypothetical protein EC957_009099 [Mortierella hygrophila]